MENSALMAFSKVSNDFKGVVNEAGFNSEDEMQEYMREIQKEVRGIKNSPILATAIIEDVDIFITGDKDFHVLDIEQPKIMPMTNFLEKYNN